VLQGNGIPEGWKPFTVASAASTACSE